MLKIEHVNPFVKSAVKTMEMMLGERPAAKRPYLKGTQPNWGDVSGIVGFAGAKVHGSIAMCMPDLSALHVYKNMTGDETTDITPDVQDAISELANIIAGNAKTVFAKMNLNFNITIPTVIVGKEHMISYQDKDTVLVVPFDMDGSPFYMELLIKVIDES